MDLVRQYADVNDAICELRLRSKRQGKKNSERCTLKRTFADEAEREIARLLGAQDFSERVDFDALESAIKATAMNFAASLLESFLNADASDHQATTCYPVYTGPQPVTTVRGPGN